MQTIEEMVEKIGRDYHREIAEERDRLRALNVELMAALEQMIEISKRNSEPDLMLIAIRTCAAHAVAKAKEKANAV